MIFEPFGTDQPIQSRTTLEQVEAVHIINHCPQNNTPLIDLSTEEFINTATGKIKCPQIIFRANKS